MRSYQSTLNTLPPPPADANIDHLLQGFVRGEGLQLTQKIKPKYPPLDRLPCANVQIAKYTVCDRPGTSSCSKCKLVAYCSKDCQRAHWNIHKIDCQNKMLAADWKPAYEVERRTPAFIVNEHPRDGFERWSMGMSLWGNMPARDVVNLSENENDLGKDLNLAFIASGDLRNVMKTIVDLPEDYTGKINVVVNDMNPVIFYRNVLLLLILSRVEDERLAVDVALHFWYSVFMPHEYRMQISSAVLPVLESLRDQQYLPLGPKSKLTIATPDDDWLGLIAHFVTPNQQLSEKDIQSSYDQVRRAPSRVDFRDRQYAKLRPSHRVAFQEFRSFGLVLPFGAVNAHFNIPNRSLFSPDGIWLQTDYADPLEGYETQEVIASGKAHGGRMEDIYGCLYFHISDQLQALVTQIKKLSITFHLSLNSAQDLVDDLRQGKLSKNGLTPDVKFDRIDVSNILDDNYVGIEPLLTKWKPFLADTKHAAIVGYFMNWAHPGMSNSSTWQPTDEETQQAIAACIKYTDQFDKGTKANPAAAFSDPGLMQSMMFKSMNQYPMFLENSRGFLVYLRAKKLDQILKRTKLVRRVKNKIFPHRLGLNVDDPENARPHFKDSEDFYIHASFNGFLDWRRTDFSAGFSDDPHLD